MMKHIRISMQIYNDSVFSNSQEFQLSNYLMKEKEKAMPKESSN